MQYNTAFMLYLGNCLINQCLKFLRIVPIGIALVLVIVLFDFSFQGIVYLLVLFVTNTVIFSTVLLQAFLVKF